MKKAYTTLLLSFFLLQAHAQSPFFKTYGGSGNEKANGICKNNDGGFTIVGETNLAGDKDMYAVRVNANGDTMWTKRYGTVNEEAGVSVTATLDGGFVMTGYTISSGGSRDVYLVKTGSDGLLQWSKTIGGTGDDDGRSIIQTADSGYAIVGFTESFSQPATKVYLIKTDDSGNIKWTKTFRDTILDKGLAVIQTDDGGYALTGSSYKLSSGWNDIILIKTDSLGDISWSKNYSGPLDDQGTGLLNTLDGGYMILGYSTSFGQGDYDFLLMKLNSTGNLQWSRSIGSDESEYAAAVLQDSDSSYLVAGSTSMPSQSGSAALLLKVSNSGILRWTKAFAAQPFSGIIGSNGFGGIAATGDGYVACGYGTVSGNSVAILVKTDTTGNGLCYDPDLSFTSTIPNIVTTNPSFLTSSGGTTSSFGIESATNTVVKNLCDGVGIPSPAIESKAFKIYPNPATGLVHIIVPTAFKNNVSVEVFNAMGMLVLKTRGAGSIDISALALGMYLVKVKAGNHISMEKLVKE